LQHQFLKGKAKKVKICFMKNSKEISSEIQRKRRRPGMGVEKGRGEMMELEGEGKDGGEGENRESVSLGK
jgi:hypothetical protein